VSAVRAVAFDFNGTLSDDEPILLGIYAQIFAERGRPLSADEYYGCLAGLSDPEIMRTWLGPSVPDLDELVDRRIALYRAAVVDGSTVRAPVREAVRYAAGRVPVAVVSGAARIEIEPVLRGAGIARCVGAIVAAEDVEEGKPDPACYRRALDALARLCDSEPQAPLLAEQVLVFEDTEAGVASAKAAGMLCVAVAGTASAGRLAAADAVVPTLDVEVLRRFLV
jgi:beta-phosphoglucomutase